MLIAYYEIIHVANEGDRYLLRSADVLDMLISTSMTVLRASMKTVRTCMRRKLLVFIKFGDLLQGVSLENPFACVQKSYGSAIE